MQSQRDLAKSGPRGGFDSRDSGGLGSAANPGRREPGRDRLQNQDRGGIGPTGGGLTQRDKGSGGDPTASERGLIESTLRSVDRAFQEAFAAPGKPIPDFDDESRKLPTRRPSDEDRPPLKPKPEEEDDPIIPGDPDDLGARGRRRGTRDSVNASPVLRRGLLGV